MGAGGQILGEAWVRINLDDLKKLDLKVDDSGRKFKTGFDKMETQTQKLGRAFGALGGAIATLGVIKVGNDIFQASLKMENLNKMLLANEGSAKKAEAAMAKYLQMAKSPGLNLSQITQGMTQLKSLGVSATQAEKTIMALGNQMVLSGRGAEEFGRVMVQIQQSIGKGRLMAEDLRVVAESMPMIRKLMTDAFGTADTDKLAKMGVSAIDFWTKLTTQMEKSPKAIGGTQNSIDNFKDSLLQFEAALGKVVMPSVGRFLDSLTKMMDQFNAMPEATKNVIGKAVVGGLGILGIGAALSSVLIIAGQVKSALVGLGAVNVGGGVTSALAGSAGSGVASGAVAGAVAKQGFTIGAALMTIGKVSIVAGTVALAYDIAKRIKDTTPVSMDDGRAVIGGTPFDRGGSMTFSEIARDYNRNVATNQEVSKNKWTSSMPVPFKAQPAIIPTAEETKKLEKEAEKAKEYAEAYQKFTDEINAMAYPEKPPPPDILGYDRGTPRSISAYEFRKEQSMPTLSKEYSPPMAGGISALGLSDSRAGLTSGLGLGVEVSKVMQEQEKAKLHSIEVLAMAEKKADDDLYANWIAGNKKVVGEIGSGTEEIGSEWNKLDEEIKGGIKEVGDSWSKVISSVKDNLIDLYDTLEPLLIKAGMGEKTAKNINTWVDGISRIISAYGIGKNLYTGGAEIASKLGIGGKGAEMSGGVATGGTAAGAVAGNGSSIGLSSVMKVAGPVAIAYGGYKVGSNYYEMFFGDEKVPPNQAKQYMQEQYHIGKYEDPVRGVYANTKGYEDAMAKLGIEPYPLAKGGWVMKPTIALIGEREPELVIPKSKLGSSGLGGNTHIEIHNINMPTMDRATAENVVVNAINDARRHNRI
jgi:tape measure domain-containing protein